MRRLHLTRLAVAVGLLAGTAAAAPPEAFLHTADKDGTWDGRERGVGLRSNTELPFFAYVRNSSPDPFPKAITVLLTRDRDGKLPVAKGTLAGIEGNKAVRVPLALVALPAAPVPPAPAKPGDPAPAVPTAAVPDVLYLHTETVGEDGVLKAPVQELPVTIAAPANYIEPVGLPTFKQVGGEYELTVTLKDRMTEVDGQRRQFRGPPAKVKLDVRPALMPGLDGTAPKAGTYESVVPPGAESVVLRAEKLRFPGGKPGGVFAVSVDGYDRAFAFEVGSEGNNATPVRDGFTRLDLPAYAVPGKPLPVRLEVFHEPAQARPLFTFQRARDGQPQPLTTAKDHPTTRDETRTLRAGDGGELVFGSTVKDLVVSVDTAGVYGQRAFVLATNPATPTKPEEKFVTFDDTPPAVRPEAIPDPNYVGGTLQVFATVIDDESTVKEVLFFLGDPPGPDGKLAAASEGVMGVLAVPAKGAKAVAGRYTSAFALPDAKGRVKVGVRAVNGAGLVTVTEAVVVRVVEPPAKTKRTVGDIKVRVIQGSTPERPQPGLPVELRSGAGAIVAAQTTDDKGEATFKDVPPGAYILYTVKLADLGAKAYSAVSVVADKQSDVTLEVKR